MSMDCGPYRVTVTNLEDGTSYIRIHRCENRVPVKNLFTVFQDGKTQISEEAKIRDTIE